MSRHIHQSKHLQPPSQTPNIVEANGTNPLVERLTKNVNFVNISALSGVIVELRYATTENFLGKNIYGNFNQCFLHRLAAEKLIHATRILSEKRPGWKLLVFDGLRPLSIQIAMWNLVKNTALENYVANPDNGSLHNYGFAIDLTLTDSSLVAIDMGTPFDYFGPLAEPKMELELLKSGYLTTEQIGNRLILRSIMEEAGFIQLPIEWWHFNALSREEVQRQFKMVE